MAARALVDGCVAAARVSDFAGCLTFLPETWHPPIRGPRADSALQYTRTCTWPKHDEQASATAEACGRATRNARVVLMQRAGGALTAAVRSIWVPASVDGWLRSLAAAAADRRASGKARELPAAIPAGPRRIAFRRTFRAVLPAWATPRRGIERCCRASSVFFQQTEEE